VGELRRLGINVAKSTVETYCPRVRKPPSPTWKTFLKKHTNIRHLLPDFYLQNTCKFVEKSALVRRAIARRFRAPSRKKAHQVLPGKEIGHALSGAAAQYITISRAVKRKVESVTHETHKSGARDAP
jgi:hypothetical protein